MGLREFAFDEAQKNARKEQVSYDVRCFRLGDGPLSFYACQSTKSLDAFGIKNAEHVATVHCDGRVEYTPKFHPGQQHD